MLGSPFPLQSQGWHELPSTRGFPKKPGAHLGGWCGQWVAVAQALSALGPSNRPCPYSGTASQLTARKRPQRSRVCRDTGCGPLSGCSLSRSCKDGSGHHTLAFSRQAPVYSGGARHQVLGSPPHGPIWLHWPPQRAVLIQPAVGVVFRSGSIKTLGHQPTVGTRGGWPSLLVGRHGQGAGAADAGGCRVLGPSAHEAGLAALAVVALSAVLAALGRGNSSAPTVEALLPPAPSPAMQGPCPGHPPLSRPQHTHNHRPEGALAFPTLCLWCLLPTPHRSLLTTQTPEPGRQRSEWPWH